MAVNLSIPERWRSFTLDDGNGKLIGVELTANPLERFGWSVMGQGWSTAGSSNASPQDALEQALAEIQAHETLASAATAPTGWVLP
jgi:hypothetical protein